VVLSREAPGVVQGRAVRDVPDLQRIRHDAQRVRTIRTTRAADEDVSRLGRRLPDRVYRASRRRIASSHERRLRDLASCDTTPDSVARTAGAGLLSFGAVRADAGRAST
jgi:hypothetical protein